MVVNVESVEQLLAAARKVVKVGEQQYVKIYLCELNAAGLPVDMNARTQVSNMDGAGDAVRKGGGVVWICVGGSPTSNPQKQKPRSPFLIVILRVSSSRIFQRLLRIRLCRR